MAKLLKDLKRKEIRCLVVEDFETGRIFKVRNDDDIKECLGKYSVNEITKVFNPTNEQKQSIYNMMEVKEEDKKVVSKIEGMDLLINIIPMLTDIEIDLTKDEDVELINEIISDPNEVFDMVAVELNSIIMKMNLDWIDNLKLLNELPDEVLKALS